MGRIRQSWLLGIVMLKNAPQHTQRRHSYVQSEWETLLPTCANACWRFINDRKRSLMTCSPLKCVQT